MDPQESHWCDLDWSPWIPLDSEIGIYREHIPPDAGVYRVRAKQKGRLKKGLFYIGQTGRSLRGRGYALRNHSLRSAKPWNDPHTAAPTLWAYRIEDGHTFEISVAETQLPEPERQCFEDYLIFSHRTFHSCSPTANFGVPHPMWNKPSNKAAGRVMKKRKIPVYSISLRRATHTNQLDSPDWLGLEWHGPSALANASPPQKPGVYKFTKGKDFLYCGEATNLHQRIGHYRRRGLLEGTSIDFAVIDAAESNHLKEREVDMIGAYYASEGKCPSYQYTGHLHT